MYVTELLGEGMEGIEECLALGQQSSLVGSLPCSTPPQYSTVFLAMEGAWQAIRDYEEDEREKLQEEMVLGTSRGR